MYHHRPTYPEPVEVQSSTILPLNAPWRYAATSGDLGTSWKEANYNDAAWPIGNGLFVVETPTIELPGPRSTALPLGQPTAYFLTSFEFL